MATYEELEILLNEASHLLDRAAENVRDVGLDPEENVRKIGEAMVLVAEIRQQIYKQRPDLKPEYLDQK